MADRTTDGAPSSAGDPAASSTAAWESVLNEGIASSGIDPNATLEAMDDPADPVPQPASDGSSAGADTGSPATPRAAVTGDDGAASPATDPAGTATEPDPLANAEPFTWTVSGEARTMDGAYRIPGEGLYVPDDKVPQFQLMMSRAESLDRTNRELYDKHSTLERLTEWRQTGADGKESVLTGRDAIEASRVQMGNTLAELQVLRDVFNNPQKLASLLTFDEQTGAFGHNADTLERLRLNLQLTQRDVTDAVRRHVSRIATPQTPAAPAEQPFNAQQSAPAIVEFAITQAHDADALAKLTAEDRAWAAKIAPRYVRSATPDEVRTNPALKLGEPILEPEFVDLLRERAALRATTAKQVETSATAGKFNAGMNAGRTPAKVPAKAPVAPTPPTPGKKIGKQEQWDHVLQSALQEIVTQ